MMDLLKRFEDDSLDDSGIIAELADENDDGVDDFLSRFGNLDLGKSSPHHVAFVDMQ